MDEEELLPCPFCGGQAEIKESNVFMRAAAIVRCKTCHCSTSLLITGLELLSRRDITMEEAVKESVASWNRRANIPHRSGKIEKQWRYWG